MKVLNIGIGLAGTKFASALAEHTKVSNPKGVNLVVMNVSKEELDSTTTKVHAQKYLIGDLDGGAGKNRETAIEALTGFDIKGFVHTVGSTAKREGVDVITVSFSTGGGSGSGIGPALVNILHDLVENAIETVRVIGIALLPAFSEGIGVFRNTLLCINDIKRTIKKGCRYTVVENNYRNIPGGGSFIERRNFINNYSANLIADYLIGNHSKVSRLGVLDMNDRRLGMSYSGLHGFARLKEYEVVPSTMILPGTSHVKHIMAEIPEDCADNYESAVHNSLALDSKYGYTISAEGIVAYHGYSSLEKDTVNYRKRFEDLKIADNDDEIDTGDLALTGLKSSVFNYDVVKSKSNHEVASESEAAPDQDYVSILNSLSKFEE